MSNITSYKDNSKHTYYYQISKGKTENEKLNRKLNQLANIGSFVAMPFYLSFLNFAQEHKLAENFASLV